jgi:hypothetical protein
MHAINRNTSIVNHKSINLSNSDSGCTCVHGLGASPKQAPRAAPRQRLAAINITQWFNSFTAHKKNDSSKGSEESHRGLTTSRMGLHKTANTRRASRRAVRCAAQSSEPRGDVGAAAQNIEHVARDFLLQTMATGRLLRAILGRPSQQGKARGHGEMELRILSCTYSASIWWGCGEKKIGALLLAAQGTRGEPIWEQGDERRPLFGKERGSDIVQGAGHRQLQARCHGGSFSAPREEQGAPWSRGKMERAPACCSPWRGARLPAAAGIPGRRGQGAGRPGRRTRARRGLAAMAGRKLLRAAVRKTGTGSSQGGAATGRGARLRDFSGCHGSWSCCCAMGEKLSSQLPP